MKFSRRGILGGLFAATAATAALASAPPTQPTPTPQTPPTPPPPPKQTFAKGMIKPCYHIAPAIPCHSHSYSGAHSHSYSTAAMVTDYEIFDGEKFVPFNSTAGQQVIADLT